MQEFSEIKQPVFVEWVERCWDIRIKTVRTDKKIQGSPERSAARTVVEDDRGTLYLIEKYARSRFKLRNRVARTVHYLNTNGLDTAVAYLKCRQGDFLPFFRENCFGITPFLDSTVLMRPDYLKSGQMGRNFAAFLVQLYEASRGIEFHIPLERFSIKSYILKLFSEMERYDIVVYEKFSPFLSFLDRSFMEHHDRLSWGFCHGDLHPLNVIWKGDQVKAVIDWEFSGLKPRYYDAANLLGCAGIEDPESLAGPMVVSFLDQIRESGLYIKEEWRFFPEYILALRFGWLAEWLRKEDKEMIQMEADFMRILVDNMDVLRSVWAM